MNYKHKTQIELNSYIKHNKILPINYTLLKRAIIDLIKSLNLKNEIKYNDKYPCPAYFSFSTFLKIRIKNYTNNANLNHLKFETKLVFSV